MSYTSFYNKCSFLYEPFFARAKSNQKYQLKSKVKRANINGHRAFPTLLLFVWTMEKKSTDLRGKEMDLQTLLLNSRRRSWQRSNLSRCASREILRQTMSECRLWLSAPGLGADQTDWSGRTMGWSASSFRSRLPRSGAWRRLEVVDVESRCCCRCCAVGGGSSSGCLARSIDLAVVGMAEVAFALEVLSAAGKV